MSSRSAVIGSAAMRTTAMALDADGENGWASAHGPDWRFTVVSGLACGIAAPRPTAGLSACGAGRSPSWPTVCRRLLHRNTRNWPRPFPWPGALLSDNADVRFQIPLPGAIHPWRNRVISGIALPGVVVVEAAPLQRVAVNGTAARPWNRTAKSSPNAGGQPTARRAAAAIRLDPPTGSQACRDPSTTSSRRLGP